MPSVQTKNRIPIFSGYALMQDSSKDVLTAARERVRWIFDNYTIVRVSFSGGKDSPPVKVGGLSVAAGAVELRASVRSVRVSSASTALPDCLPTVGVESRFVALLTFFLTIVSLFRIPIPLSEDGMMRMSKRRSRTEWQLRWVLLMKQRQNGQ